MKPPQILADLYRDLRDRRLLVPVVALLAGLIAIPMLLKSDDPPAPPAPPAAGGESAATIPAVLADSEVSVRDYRERLEDLKSKNPFHQQFQVSAADEAGTGATAGDPTAGEAAALGGEAPGISDAVAPTDTAIAPSDPATGGTDQTTGDSTQDDAEVVNKLFVRRVDLMVGVQGDLKRRNGVQPMTILPSESKPVAAFLGTDEKGKRAAFVVSSDVTSVSGDGACVPSPECLFITLEKGESAILEYGPDGQTYEIELLAIKDVKLKSD